MVIDVFKKVLMSPFKIGEGGKLVSMVKGDRFVSGLGPVIDYDSSCQSGASLESHLIKLLENLCVHVLEHRGHNVLLKRGQVLRNHAVHLIVLFPELFCITG
jgi:hypothetical protein